MTIDPFFSHLFFHKLPDFHEKSFCTIFYNIFLTFPQGATRRLDHYPESVEEFVDHLSFLGKIGSEMPALNKEYNVVIKLYTIAKDFELPIVPEDYALYQTLSPSFQHLKVSSCSRLYLLTFCLTVKCVFFEK